MIRFVGNWNFKLEMFYILFPTINTISLETTYSESNKLISKTVTERLTAHTNCGVHYATS